MVKKFYSMNTTIDNDQEMNDKAIRNSNFESMQEIAEMVLPRRGGNFIPDFGVPSCFSMSP